MTNAYLKEIFDSIQGEALYMGEKQIFIRFCGCNLNCKYCDTDFEQNNKIFIHDTNKTIDNPIDSQTLQKIINNFSTKTVSLTGGEPLLQTEFLSEFLPLIKNKKIYLETNGTLYKELEKIINSVHVISMDIKLKCSTNQDNQFFNNEEFIKIAQKYKKEIFAKIVIDKHYLKEELNEAINLTNKYNIPLILQPMDCKNKNDELNKDAIIELCNWITNKCNNFRFIPQMHKYLHLL